MSVFTVSIPPTDLSPTMVKSYPLQFNPHSIIVDNYSAYWLMFRQATNKWVPPFTAGAVLTCENASQIGMVETGTPFTGGPNPVSGTSYPVTVTFTDDIMAYAPGASQNSGGSVIQTISTSKAGLPYDFEFSYAAPAGFDAFAFSGLPAPGMRWLLAMLDASAWYQHAAGTNTAHADYVIVSDTTGVLWRMPLYLPVGAANTSFADRISRSDLAIVGAYDNQLSVTIQPFGANTNLSLSVGMYQIS